MDFKYGGMIRQHTFPNGY